MKVTVIFKDVTYESLSDRKFIEVARKALPRLEGAPRRISRRERPRENFFAGPFVNFHAFLWQQGVLTDLGTLPGDTVSYPNGINNKGQIAGQGSRAILWDSGGNLVDLNTLVPSPPFSPLYLLVATDINDEGEIVRLGLAADGQLHGFLAMPCDERHRTVQGCHNNSNTRDSKLHQSGHTCTEANSRSFTNRDSGLQHFGCACRSFITTRESSEYTLPE